MLDCRECALAEGPYWRFLACKILDYYQQPNPFSGYGLVTRALLGGSPPLTHYDRHRAEYIRTGEHKEFTRMLKQVK